VGSLLLRKVPWAELPACAEGGLGFWGRLCGVCRSCPAASSAGRSFLLHTLVMGPFLEENQRILGFFQYMCAAKRSSLPLLWVGMGGEPEARGSGDFFQVAAAGIPCLEMILTAFSGFGWCSCKELPPGTRHFPRPCSRSFC